MASFYRVSIDKFKRTESNRTIAAYSGTRDVLVLERQKLIEEDDDDDEGNFFDKKERANFTGSAVREITSPCTLIPLPYMMLPGEEKREVIFIAGPEGAGKTTWARNYANQFRNSYPSSNFWVISKTEDTIINELKPDRIKIDKDFVKPISPHVFKDGLVMFDDVENVHDDKQRKAIEGTRDAIIEDGRHDNVFIMAVAHLSVSNKTTKTSLANSSMIVLFPNQGDNAHVRYTLDKYCGFDKKTITKCMKVKSHWIAVSKRAPVYVLHERGAFAV